MADLKLGGTTPTAFYLGATAVIKVYLGATEVWANSISLTGASITVTGGTITSSNSASAADSLLQESGDFLLLEDASNILLE